MIYLKFFKSLLAHKYYVFVAGLQTGVPLWRLIVHDWQKFTPWEFGYYARKFHGGDYLDKESKFTVVKGREGIELGFAYAWLHHENTAPHHWGYWIPRSGKYTGQPLDMPETYVREMVADWMGASKAYTGSWNMSRWLNKNGPGLTMSDKTTQLVHNVLLELEYDNTDNCMWSYGWAKAKGDR